MRRYYIEMIDDDGEVIFQSNWFKTKAKAKKWVFENFFFQNGYEYSIEVITCEDKNATSDEDFNDYDCIECEKVYKWGDK